MPRSEIEGVAEALLYRGGQDRRVSIRRQQQAAVRGEQEREAIDIGIGHARYFTATTFIEGLLG